MRGKIVNLCIGFMNLLFGVLVIIFTIHVPQDKTLMTKILFGSISVDDEFMLACDADHNSTVDLSDLTAIALCLEDDYTISQMN